MSSIRGNYIGAAFIFLMPIFIDYIVKTFLGGSLDPGFLSNMNKIIFGVLTYQGLHCKLFDNKNYTQMIIDINKGQLK